MRQIVLAFTMLVALLGAPIGGATAAQQGTPVSAPDDPMGTWLVRETLPPPGVEPPLFFVVTLFADGNAIASSFTDGGTLQGAWRDDASGVVVSLVGPVVTRKGIAPETVARIRAAIEVSGDELSGAYTVETLDGDLANPTFAYNGPIAGRRIAAEGPNPAALRVAEAARGGATPTP